MDFSFIGGLRRSQPDLQVTWSAQCCAAFVQAACKVNLSVVMTQWGNHIEPLCSALALGCHSLLEGTE